MLPALLNLCCMESRGSVFDCTLRLIIGSRFQKSFFASLLTMSICARVVVSVAFQQVNGSPDAETCAKGNYQSLKNADSRVEKFHICVAGIIGC